uniref:3-ketosteroid-9-alpha-monooxygenase oxygenase component-like C-terminal domain-containing protein n=1 Tax=Accipiter nisus TaxID=211598 RepID=A0A8B9M8D0_9AVES
MGSGWCGAAGPERGVLLFLPLPVLLLLLLLVLLLLGCSRPLALRRGPGQVGYLPAPGLSRSQAARRARRARRPGALPPAFPNGWYRLLDSAQLPRGAVRSLALLVPDFARVRTWPSCEVNGMLLVWYHCEGISPTWAVPEQREITTKEWVFRGQTEHLVDAHIQEIPENAADMAHLAFLHGPAILGGSDLRYTRSKLWDFMKHIWKAEWRPEPEPNEHCSQLLVQHTVTIFGKHISLTDLMVSARQVGPGLVFLMFEHAFLGRGIILQTVTPLEPLLQNVVHKIYYQKNMPAIIPKFILRAECIQFERDITIWNNKQYLPKPLLVREDSSIQKHRRWYAQFYSEKSTRLLAQKEGLDW